MNFYEILPHTADVRLRAVGETLEDLFEQAVLGMAQILKHNANLAKIDANIAKKIILSAPNSTILLIDFLSGVLTASYEEKAVFLKVKFSKILETELEAEIFGPRADGFDEDIKAVTYHEAKIIKTKDGLEATVIFDI